MAATPPGPTPPGAGPAYSKAFDNIVQGPNDVVGLLAYALFKESVREEMQLGAQPNNANRNPPPATVLVFRGAAEQRLAEVIQNGIAQATPDIQRDAVGNAITATETALSTKIDGVGNRLEKHVTGRTGFGTAIVTNVIAWVITLALTAVILVLANRPAAEDIVTNAANSLIPSEDPATRQRNGM
jgi:hypothetical protein